MFVFSVVEDLSGMDDFQTGEEVGLSLLLPNLVRPLSSRMK